MSFFGRTLDVVGSFHYGHIQFLNKTTTTIFYYQSNRIESIKRFALIKKKKKISVRFVCYCSREREEIKPRSRCWHGRGRLWCCLWGRHRLFSKSVASPFLTLTQISLSLSKPKPKKRKKKKNLLLRKGLRGFHTLFLSLSLGSVERERDRERNRSKWQAAMKEWKKERRERNRFFFFLFLFIYFLWLMMREKLFPTMLAFFFFFLGVFYFFFLIIIIFQIFTLPITTLNKTFIHLKTEFAILIVT